MRVRHPRPPLRRALPAAVLTALLLTTGLVAHPPPATADDPCPPAYPLADVQPGQQGTGLTVVQGTQPTTFDVEVVDVLHDALAPGLPLVVIEVDSPEIDRVGGVWSGMSGSPVLIDGQLLGALAYGFSMGASRLAGVTPTGALLDLTTRPAPDPPLELTEQVTMSPRVRARADGDGLSSTATRRMDALRLPLQVSGPAQPRVDAVAARLERTHPGLQVVRTGIGRAAEVPASALVPGGNLAVSAAYGDVTLAGVGTVTAICDGTVLGFGHPLLYSGATRLGLHAASAVRIVDDPVFGPAKLANLGAPVGTIEQDRLTGVAGHLRSLPATTAITTEITDLEQQHTVTGRTDAVFDDLAAEALLLHGWTAYDLLVFDNPYVAGTAEVAWTMTGVRSDGQPWSLTRGNRHASRYDLSTAALSEAIDTLSTIVANPHEQVRVTAVAYTADAAATYDALEIVADELRLASLDAGTDPGELPEVSDEQFVPASEPFVVEPGETLVVQVPLRRFRAGLEAAEVRLDIPPEASGYGELVVTGGGEGWYGPVDPEEPFGGYAQRSGAGLGFDALLESLAQRPRNDELHVSLHLSPHDPGWDDGWDDGFDPDEPVQPEPAPAPEPAPEHESAPEPEPGPIPGPEPIPPDEPLPPPEEPMLPSPPGEGGLLTVSATVPLDAVIEGFAVAGVVVSSEPDIEPWPPDAMPPVAPSPDDPSMPEFGDDLAFEDVDPSSPHAAAIVRAAALGLTTGVSEDPPRFAPALPVRRDQAASFVARLLATGQRELPEVDAPRFVDLAGNVHAGAVESLAAAGIVQGRGDARFEPASEITRAQLTSMLLEALRWSTGEPYTAEGGPHFPDVTGVHADAIDAAYEHGLVTGRPDGTFGPGLAVRRDQAASLLVRSHGVLHAAG